MNVYYAMVIAPNESLGQTLALLKYPHSFTMRNTVQFDSVPK